MLDSIFGTEANAESIETISGKDTTKNSQNIALLQTNGTTALVLQERKSKPDESALVEEDTPNIVSDNALYPTAKRIGIPDEVDTLDPLSDQISVYVVRKGDSISQIAEMFDVSVNTILWGNDMKRGDALKEGDVLFILPISGVEHEVKKGETIKSIAIKYKADVSDILMFNGIAEGAKLVVGEKLIIPDGEISVDGPAKTSNVAKSKAPVSPQRNANGYFINPVPGAIKTQGLHGKNAVDLAAPIGTPIYAAASGKILLARYGWNGAYGNMVLIEHPNGTKTLYSHLSKLASVTGQNVSQGELIGYVGNTGRVRASKGGNGAHLHFEVYGAKNPGIDRSWK